MDITLSRSDIITRFRDRIALGKRTRLYKEEFETLVEGFIQRLNQLDQADSIQKLCRAEIELLEEGYPQLTLASDYIPRYRKAIEAAIATGKLTPSPHQYLHHQRLTGLPQRRTEHWALTFFKYSQDQYEQLDHRQARTNRKRLLNLQNVNPWQYLDTLDELLLASGKFAARHRTIAIVGLTGRRFGEVVARGTFSLTQHPYLLHFEGQQKSDRAGYDIITLIPAEIVLMHLERLRKMPELLSLKESKGAALTKGINKFDVQVNRECDKLLLKPGIVPPLQGKAHVTIHNLRSLWGAIATFLFCPPQHHEYAFLQHYLGHVLESSATGHYFRYVLVDKEGVPLRDKGVKLQDVPELPLLDVEEAISDDALSFEELSAPTDLAPALPDIPSSRSSKTSVRRTKMEIEALLESFKKEWQQQLEQDHENLRSEWSEQLADVKSTIDIQLKTLRRQIQPDGQNLIEQLETLESENQHISADRDRLKADLKQAQQDTQAMAAHLQEAQAKLDSFRQLLLGNDEEPKAKQTQSKQTNTKEPEKLPKTPQASRARGRAPGKAAQRAQVIFDALRAWNAEHPGEELAFSPGLLETAFRVHRKAAKEFCKQFQNEIEDHHAEIGVERILTHNKGKDIEGFKAFVSEFK